MAKKKDKDIWIRVCPKCGAIPEMKDDLARNWGVLPAMHWLGALSGTFWCQKCGHRGISIEVKADELGKIKFKGKKKK